MIRPPFFCRQILFPEFSPEDEENVLKVADEISFPHATRFLDKTIKPLQSVSLHPLGGSFCHTGYYVECPPHTKVVIQSREYPAIVVNETNYGMTR